MRSNEGDQMDGSVIERGLEILEEYGWHQGSYGNEEQGYCVAGALYRALEEKLGYDEGSEMWQRPFAKLCQAMQAQIGTWNIASWNDAPERTFSQVREVFRRAAVEGAHGIKAGQFV